MKSKIIDEIIRENYMEQLIELKTSVFFAWFLNLGRSFSESLCHCLFSSLSLSLIQCKTLRTKWTQAIHPHHPNTNTQSQLRKCECWYFFASSWITIFYPFHFIPFHLFSIHFEKLHRYTNSSRSSSSKNIRFIPHQQIKCNAIMAYNEHSCGLLMPKYTSWITKAYIVHTDSDTRIFVCVPNVSKCVCIILWLNESNKCWKRTLIS